MKLPFVPMLATLSREVVTGPEWVFEEKYDGIRLLAVRRSGRTRLFSRNLIDRTASWPAVSAAIDGLPGRDLVLDGEVYATDRLRVSRFQLLQRQATPTFAVFDLPMLDGTSLTGRPLAERRERLEQLLQGARAPLRLARRLPRDGSRAYRMAEERQWEGIIAKRDASPYTPGLRSKDWLKVKVRHQAEFVIGAGPSRPDRAVTSARSWSGCSTAAGSASPERWVRASITPLSASSAPLWCAWSAGPRRSIPRQRCLGPASLDLAWSLRSPTPNRPGTGSSGSRCT